jgi:hypothetical protein
VELGAFVVVPGGEDFTAIHEVQPDVVAASQHSRAMYSSRKPIVGNDVLQSWMQRIRKLGVQSLWLTSGSVTRSALGAFARQGIERLLVIKLSSYAEMDLTDLFRFHCERRHPVTEAHDSHGELGVSLLDNLALRADGENSSATTKFEQVPYQFNGYAKRISSATERQELVGDALTGACAMQPFGKQIGDQVWIGEDVNLDSSARIIGPTYIGARTTVRAGVTIGPFASVERDCIVDCGTTVERSTVLPHTYLAPGLLIRQGLVDGSRFEHLGFGTVADLQPAGLGSRILSRKSRVQPSKTPTTSPLPADSNLVWEFAGSSSGSQAWLQVQL